MKTYQINFVQAHLTDSVTAGSEKAALNKAMRRFVLIALLPHRGGRAGLRLGEKLTIEIIRRA